ncbi:hypothetical protein K1X76_07425 [bacterium]|nr:hypothetical protein [bacterium]
MAKRNIKTDFFKERLTQVNKVLEKLEGEVEKAVERLMKRGEKSSKVIRKNLDEVLNKLGGLDIYSKASEKKDELTAELKTLADDVVAKLKKFDLKAANTVLKEVRGNIDQIIDKLQDSNIVEFAKDKALSTKKQVLQVLSIPSQEEVDALNRKVVNLEKKLKTITKKAA